MKQYYCCCKFVLWVLVASSINSGCIHLSQLFPQSESTTSEAEMEQAAQLLNARALQIMKEKTSLPFEKALSMSLNPDEDQPLAAEPMPHQALLKLRKETYSEDCLITTIESSSDLALLTVEVRWIPPEKVRPLTVRYARIIGRKDVSLSPDYELEQ